MRVRDVVTREVVTADLVHVVQGEVALGGRVETKTEAELVEAFARMPGVVSVRSPLVWEEDDRRARVSTRP